MRNFGAGLVQLGCKPSNYTKVSIYATNRIEASPVFKQLIRQNLH